MRYRPPPARPSWTQLTTGTPIEIHRTVNATGTVSIGGKFRSVGQQFAGRRITLRLETTLAHVVVDGVLARTIPLTLSPAQRARLQGARMAGPAPLIDQRPARVQRTVSCRGGTQIIGQRVQVGLRYAGQIVMFAPDHAATASELARVVATGGQIALANWTPEGGLGQMFKMMAPFLPPPVPGVANPFEWGREELVRKLLDDAFELDIEERISTLNVPTGEDYWQLFSSSYGPTKTAAEALDEDRRDQFHQTWVEFFDTPYRSDGGVSHTREYLLVVGTRR